MSNATFGLLICAILSASPVLAQPATETAAAATPAAKPAAPASTVSGIVVEGLPKKSCSSRDKQCIAVVVAQLQQLYPKQLQQWCDMVEDRVAFMHMHADDALPSTRAPTAFEYSAPAVTKVACANVHKQ